MTVVVTLKLVSGEEIIGKRKPNFMDSDSLVVLEDARRLQLVPNGAKGMGLALTPILMGNIERGDFPFQRRHVMIECPVDDNFEKQYLQEVSGIQLI